MLPDSSQLKALVVRTAQEELLPRFNHVGYQVKADNSLVTEADIASHRRLKRELAGRWPHIGFLSEEMPRSDQEALLRNENPCWCLDPLDGTSNFVAGVPVFALSLALIAQGRPALGLVYDPVRNECFRADEGRGAWLNDQPLQTHAAGFPIERSIAVVDFKRLPPLLKSRLLEPPYSSQRNFGSSALEWAWMAAGRGNLYLHGGQKLWDYAAGWLILNEAGGRSSTLQGEQVYRPEITPRSVVASPDPKLFETWFRWLVPDSPI